jgi:hypothetical protein
LRSAHWLQLAVAASLLQHRACPFKGHWQDVTTCRLVLIFNCDMRISQQQDGALPGFTGWLHAGVEGGRLFWLWVACAHLPQPALS